MAHVALSVSARNGETRAKDLRKAGSVPGILYGFNVNNQPLQCEYQAFHKAYVAAGGSTVLDLDVDGTVIPVLIHQLDFDPVSGRYRHVDFFAINMKEKVTANVPIVIEGESPAVKDLAAILIRDRDTISVTCLPADLPHNIKVNLSVLKEFGDAITVADLSLPAAIEIDEKEDTIIVSVQQPRKEKTPEEEAAEAAAAAAALAAVSEGTKEVPAEKKE